jgi:hypothetical protein
MAYSLSCNSDHHEPTYYSQRDVSPPAKGVTVQPESYGKSYWRRTRPRRGGNSPEHNADYYEDPAGSALSDMREVLTSCKNTLDRLRGQILSAKSNISDVTPFVNDDETLNGVREVLTCCKNTLENLHGKLLSAASDISDISPSSIYNDGVSQKFLDEEMRRLSLPAFDSAESIIADEQKRKMEKMKDLARRLQSKDESAVAEAARLLQDMQRSGHAPDLASDLVNSRSQASPSLSFGRTESPVTPNTVQGTMSSRTPSNVLGRPPSQPAETPSALTPENLSLVPGVSGDDEQRNYDDDNASVSSLDSTGTENTSMEIHNSK